MSGISRRKIDILKYTDVIFWPKVTLITLCSALFLHWPSIFKYKCVLFYVSLTVHLDTLVLRKTNLMHKLFLVYLFNLYMFRAYLGPSSGGTTLCIQQLVLIILLRWQSVVLFGLFQSKQDNRESSKKNNKYQLLYTYGCTFCSTKIKRPENF